MAPGQSKIPLAFGRPAASGTAPPASGRLSSSGAGGMGKRQVTPPRLPSGGGGTVRSDLAWRGSQASAAAAPEPGAPPAGAFKFQPRKSPSAGDDSSDKTTQGTRFGFVPGPGAAKGVAAPMANGGHNDVEPPSPDVNVRDVDTSVSAAADAATPGASLAPSGASSAAATPGTAQGSPFDAAGLLASAASANGPGTSPAPGGAVAVGHGAASSPNSQAGEGCAQGVAAGAAGGDTGVHATQAVADEQQQQQHQQHQQGPPSAGFAGQAGGLDRQGSTGSSIASGGSSFAVMGASALRAWAAGRGPTAAPVKQTGGHTVSCLQRVDSSGAPAGATVRRRLDTALSAALRDAAVPEGEEGAEDAIAAGIGASVGSAAVAGRRVRGPSSVLMWVALCVAAATGVVVLLLGTVVAAMLYMLIDRGVIVPAYDLM